MAILKVSSIYLLKNIYGPHIFNMGPIFCFQWALVPLLFKSWAVQCKHLYISELGFHLILNQYLILTFMITDKANLLNSPNIVGLEVFE